MSQPKLFDPKNLHKIHIRLPDDDGPNPYDSKTKPEGPDWLTKPSWWIAIFGMSVSLYLCREWFGI